MKSIKLKSGYFVSDWEGEILKVSYKLVSILHYGSVEEKFLLIDENDVFLEMLPKHKRRFICETSKEAEELALKVKEERKDYYKRQIKDYQKSLKELG